jgi:thiol-disulfide isomerase/thioredoxin
MLEENKCNVEVFKQLVKSYPKVLVIVKSPDCPYCGYYEDVVAEAEETIGHKVATMDIELPKKTENQEVLDDDCARLIGDELKVTAVPTAIYFKDGVETKRITPTLNREADLEALKRVDE